MKRQKSQPSQKHLIGIMLILVTNVIVTGKQVLVGNMLQRIDTIAFIFVCFIVATAALHLCQASQSRDLLNKMRSRITDVAMLNVTSVGSWLGFFFAIRFIEPAIAGAIITAVGPLVTVLLNPYFRPHRPVLKFEIFAAAGIFLSIAFLSAINQTGHSALQHAPGIELLIGFVAAVVGGLSVVGNLFFSKRLSDAKWTTSQILSCRFYLLLVLTGFYCVYSGVLTTLTSLTIGFIISIAIIGVLLPLVLKQLAINRTEPIVISLVMASSPILTFIFQLFDPRLTFSGYSLVGVTAISVILTMSTFARYRVA